MVKSLALGASAVAFGRPLVYSCFGGIPLAPWFIKREFFRNPLMRNMGKMVLDFGMRRDGCMKGVINYLRSVEIEVKMLTSALEKYYIDRLSSEDVGALNKDLAELFGIRYVYGKPEVIRIERIGGSKDIQWSIFLIQYIQHL